MITGDHFQFRHGSYVSRTLSGFQGFIRLMPIVASASSAGPGTSFGFGMREVAA